MPGTRIIQSTKIRLFELEKAKNESETLVISSHKARCVPLDNDVYHTERESMRAIEFPGWTKSLEVEKKTKLTK